MLFISCKIYQAEPSRRNLDKGNKSTILPVLSGPHINKIDTKTCQGL